MKERAQRPVWTPPCVSSTDAEKKAIPLLTAASLSRNPHRIKNSLHRQHEFNASTGTPSHVHAQTMPISIEDFVWLKQSCDAGASRTRKELQERGEVFCADALRGQRRVAQTVLVWRGQSREITCRREGAYWGGRV